MSSPRLIGNTSDGPRVLANVGYYARYLWTTGLGPTVLILIAFGIVRAIRRRSGPDVLLLVFPVVYLLIASVPLLRFERNLHRDAALRWPFWAASVRSGLSERGQAIPDPHPSGADLEGRGVGRGPPIDRDRDRAHRTRRRSSRSRAMDTRTVALDWIRVEPARRGTGSSGSGTPHRWPRTPIRPTSLAI